MFGSQAKSRCNARKAELDAEGVLIAPSSGLHAGAASVVFLVIGALIHDYVLGPRLQREMRAQEPQAPQTRRRLIMVGWFNFSLTIVVPILGVIVLGYVD